MRPESMAEIFCQARLSITELIGARAPVAVQARMMMSGLARATSASEIRVPPGKAGVAPARVMSSLTHGGEVMRGFDQASE